MSAFWSMFWFKPFRNFLRKIAIFRKFDHWSEILSMSAGRPLSQGVCPPLVLEDQMYYIDFQQYFYVDSSQPSTTRVLNSRVFQLINEPGYYSIGEKTHLHSTQSLKGWNWTRTVKVALQDSELRYYCTAIKLSYCPVTCYVGFSLPATTVLTAMLTRLPKHPFCCVRYISSFQQ